MYFSPITDKKLKRARAAGISLWYCPDSGGRLITLSTAKEIFKKQVAKEIWVRANLGKKENVTWKKCPCCQNKMTFIKEPKWAGGFEVDVCTRCRVVWLDKNEHKEVPDHNDLIESHGDSTLISDVAQAEAQVAIRKVAFENERDALVGNGPDELMKKLFGFVGLPVEMSEHGKPRLPIFTWAVSILLVLIHIYFTSNNTEVFQTFGFYPQLELNRDWTNYIFSSYIHGGWFHLLSNLYFFSVFTDDIEVAMGRVKFVLFLFISPIVINLLGSFMSFAKGTPHVGLSGVISAILVMYGLRFRHSRIAFLFPFMDVVNFRTNTFSILRSYGWLRLRAKYVALAFFMKDLFYYFLFESRGLTNIAHSGHIAGAIVGLILSLILFKKDQIDLEEIS